MGDDHGRFAGQRGAEIGEDRRLGLRVDCRERVVEQEDRGIFGQRPGDGGALLLPTREVDAALAQEGVVPVREGRERFGELGLFGRALQAPVVGHPEEDVLADRRAEEEGLLRDVAHGATEVGEGDPPHIDPVDQHPA